MDKNCKAKEPFQFHTRLHLSELTGLRAATLVQFLSLLRTVSGSCIYHHTYRFLQQHQYLSPEPPNDFAYWVADALGEDELAERLASIDTIKFSSIRLLREKIVVTIEDYLKDNPLAKLRFSRESEEFYFIKSVSFIVPTNYAASDLREFMEILRKITIDSICFHVFEARLRLERGTNDFSNWIERSVGDKELAEEISRFDSYTYTLEELRKVIIRKIEETLGERMVLRISV